jgi:hypothetical protein
MVVHEDGGPKIQSHTGSSHVMPLSAFLRLVKI